MKRRASAPNADDSDVEKRQRQSIDGKTKDDPIEREDGHDVDEVRVRTRARERGMRARDARECDRDRASERVGRRTVGARRVARRRGQGCASREFAGANEARTRTDERVWMNGAGRALGASKHAVENTDRGERERKRRERVER